MVNLYALQDYISEDSVNIALSRFIQDWNCFDGPEQTDRYPTTLDLLGYLRAVTPDSLQYVITDLLEETTLYELKTTDADYTHGSSDQYEVAIKIEADKYKIDSLGNSASVQLHDLIDVGVYGKSISGEDSLIYLQKHWITDTLSFIKIVVEDVPIKAGIDPLHKMIDRQVDDNVSTISTISN